MEGSETAVLELLRERFASLDARLDRQDEALEGIYREAKRTNGRVGGLEAWREGQEAVARTVERIRKERAAEKRAEAEQRRARRWKVFETVVGSIAVLLAAVLPLLLTGAI